MTPMSAHDTDERPDHTDALRLHRWLLTDCTGRATVGSVYQKDANCLFRNRLFIPHLCSSVSSVVQPAVNAPYSHSIVAGGLELMS